MYKILSLSQKRQEKARIKGNLHTTKKFLNVWRQAKRGSLILFQDSD